MEVNHLVNLLEGVTTIEKTLAIGLGVAAPDLTTFAQRQRFPVTAFMVNDIFACSCPSLTRPVYASRIVTAGFTVAAACCDTPYASSSTAMPAAQIQLDLMQIGTCEESIWP
jgi:hypothetical protein